MDECTAKPQVCEQCEDNQHSRGHGHEAELLPEQEPGLNHGLDQLNECNRVNPWTRSVDHSHWLDQQVEQTVVAYEYPCEWEPGRVPMYPKPFGSGPERYKQYRAMAEAEKDVTFVGRLATYKYLDMDDVGAQVMVKLAPLLENDADYYTDCLAT